MRDAELVVAELAVNALRHTTSGTVDGALSVAVTLRLGWARVAVYNPGIGDWKCSVPAPDAAFDEYGCGLLIVDNCSDRVGHAVSDGGQTMWAEFTWAADD